MQKKITEKPTTNTLTDSLFCIAYIYSIKW